MQNLTMSREEILSLTPTQITGILDQLQADRLIDVRKNWNRTEIGDRMTAEKQERNGLLRKSIFDTLLIRPQAFDLIQGLVDEGRILDKMGAFKKFGVDTDYALMKYCASCDAILYRGLGAACLIYVQ